MAARRAAREPLSRIVGRREFWGLPLAISSAVARSRARHRDACRCGRRRVGRIGARSRCGILDLGAGSGAILCALLTEFGAARGVARRSLGAGGGAGAARTSPPAASPDAPTSSSVGGEARFAGRSIVVVSNPPYVASGQIGALQREVRDHDPALALDGGPDGLDAYRAIGAELDDLLARGGRFFLEVGAGQADSVMAILRANRLTAFAAHADLAGVARVVSGRAGPGATVDETGRGD